MKHTCRSYKHKTCRTITRSKGPNQRILVFSLMNGCNNLYFTRKIRVYKEISSKEKFLTPRTARNGRKHQEKAAKQIHGIYIYIYIYSHFHEIYFSIKQKILVVGTDIVGDQLDSNQVGANSYVSSKSCNLVEHDFWIEIGSIRIDYDS